MKPPKRLSSPQKYTVGWVSGLDKELAAAIAVLDEIHQKPENFKKRPKDSNNYVWGRIGEHNVVIASLPAGTYGAVAASFTVASMMSSLPHLRFGLMVGIGAGIPRLEDDVDIRLGDVVVSQPAGTSPGVVQYDLGKLTSGGKFERTGCLNRPPEVLLHGLATLKAHHLLQESRVPEILAAMIQGYPKLGVAGPDGSGASVYQGKQHDRLFEAASTHKSAPEPSGLTMKSATTCLYRDATKEVERKDRSTKPHIHYGVIASGNSVIEDGVCRDVLLQRLDRNCICFEREAAGLMNHFPCLVIRGICDYADTHKNDRWQNYAAATAAAFAKELLEAMDGEDVEGAPTMDEVISQGKF
jgi:nucleoside phosphorylase